MSALPILIAVNLMEYWILLLLMQYVCAAHMEINRRCVLAGSCISVLGTALFSFSQSSYSFVLGMTVEIALTVLLFSRRKISDLLRYIPAFGIYFFLEVVPGTLVSELLAPTQIRIESWDTSLDLFGLAADLTLLALLLVLRHVQEKYRTPVHFSFREILGSIALIFFSLIDSAFIVMLNRAKYAPAVYFGFMILFVGGYALGVGYYLYILIESRIRIYRQTRARCETEYLRLQLDSLQGAKEDEEWVRKMRHDLNNHLSVIASLCEEGDYQEVNRYIKQLGTGTEGSAVKILTGNQVADMVVASKRKICEDRGIAFEFSGSMENLKSMEAPDICGLLANAYDNAIEACAGQTEGYIRTRVNATRNYTAIEIVNSVSGRVSVKENGAATTKKDRKNHGYGIRIMRQIAQRYHGSCTIRCDRKEFAVKIILLT